MNTIFGNLLKVYKKEEFIRIILSHQLSWLMHATLCCSLLKVLLELFKEAPTAVKVEKRI